MVDPRKLPESANEAAAPGKTEKMSTPAKETVPPASPAGASCRQHLGTLKATDAILCRLEKLVSTSGGQDMSLAVTSYLAHALHHLLASAPAVAFQTRLGLLARLKGQTNSPKPATQSPLLALSSLCSEARYTLRLFGLISLWTWGSSTLKSPPKDRIARPITYLQILSNVVYQILENGGYLASKGVIPKRLIDKLGGINAWYIWSIRAWFGHIFFQFILLWRRNALQRERLARARQDRQAREARGEKVDLFTEVAAERSVASQESRAWKKDLVNNVCWAPLCVHWCFENGIGFPDSLVGVFSFMAKSWGLWDTWAATK